MTKRDTPFEFRFDRRRYGNTTYTWVEVKHNDEWLSLGDPWPCVTPKRSELKQAAIAAINHHKETTQCDGPQH